MSKQKSSMKNKSNVSKNMQKNYKNWSQYYYGTNSNSNSNPSIYSHNWKDESDKNEKIDLGFEGWEFSLITNSWTSKIEGVKHFPDSGVNMLISAKINSGNMNNFFHVLLAHNTLSQEDSLQPNVEENDIEIKFTIKSADEDYKKWFKNWNINQEGMSLSFNSKENIDIINSMSSINEVIEKIKGRLILEKLSQRK